MQDVKRQQRQLIIILGALYALGVLSLVIMQPSFIFTYSVGTMVNFALIWLTYIAFIQQYVKQEIGLNALLTGSLPKMLIVLVGAAICYQLQRPAMLGYVLGIVLNPIVYLGNGVVEYVKKK